MPSLVLNTAIDDHLYDAATDVPTGNGYQEPMPLYEYEAPVGGGGDLNFYTLPRPEPNEQPPALPTRSYRPIELRTVRLWPLWAAIAATAAIAVTALVYRMPALSPESVGSADNTTPPLTSQCTCTSGTLTFAVRNPGRCYAIADGRNGTPDLLQKGGLYVRAGPPGLVGQVIEQATAVNGLAVEVTSTLSNELPPVYNGDCSGGPGEYFTQDRIDFINYNDGGHECANHIDTDVSLEGDAETRPPSMYLTPYVCL